MLHCGHRGITHYRGDSCRMRASPMARIAGDREMAFKVVLVDGLHHPDHFSGGFLGFLVVFIESAFYVTKLALDAERRRDELHGGDQLIGGEPFEHLDVLEGLVRSLGLFGGWGRGLGATHGGHRQCEAEEHQYKGGFSTTVAHSSSVKSIKANGKSSRPCCLLFRPPG